MITLPSVALNLIASDQESRRNIVGKSALKSHKKRLFVTDGKDVPLRGLCAYFVRTNTAIAITHDNIADVNISRLLLTD